MTAFPIPTDTGPRGTGAGAAPPRDDAAPSESRQASPQAGLPAVAARRVLAHRLAAARDAFPGRRLAPRDFADAAVLDEDGLGCDSLSRLQLAAEVADVFDLARLGREDLLLARRTVGEWAALAAEGWSAAAGGPRRFVFRSSGSQGDPRRAEQAPERLATEVAALSAILAPHGVRRVVALVPAHHIYGFLFTVLLPRRLGVPVLDLCAAGAEAAAGAAPAEARPDDLLVAAPPQWAYLASALPAAGAQAPLGVSSTGPLPQGLAARLTGEGRLARLVEVYGSSETAGIGWRDDPAAPFRLFDHWQRDGETRLRHVDGGTTDLPDRADWADTRHLLPRGRSDGAVSIGGHTVSPEAVARHLERHPQVAAARVRAFGEPARLKALVVPAAGIEPAALEAALWPWIRESLPPAERPVRLAIGAAVPRDALGKETDWAGDFGDMPDPAEATR